MHMVNSVGSSSRVINAPTVVCRPPNPCSPLAMRRRVIQSDSGLTFATAPSPHAIATANLIDMSAALQWYLKTAHDLGLSGRPGKAVVLALICVIGIVVAGLGWRRYRLPGLLVGLVVLLVLGGGFYKFGKPRLEGDSHITILFGQ